MTRCTPSLAALLAILAFAAPSGGTTITFQNGVLPDGSYSGCQDNWIYALYPTTNYGTNTWGNGIGHYSNAVKRSPIRFDVSAIPSEATVTSAKIRLLMYTIGGNRTLEAYQILRPWTQLGSTWNNYDASNAWATAGCGAAGTDRASTAAGSVAVTTAQAGTWIEVPLSASLVQGWVDGSITNYGVLLMDTTEASYEMRYRAENYTTASERPQLVVEYALDVTPPAAVANLATSSPGQSSLTLTWTAPGDDGSTGTATSYDIRYSTSTINDGNWATATQVAGEPAPAAAGTNQNMTVSGLSAGTTYYFAMKTSDEVPNTSALSNVASGTTAAAGSLLYIDLQGPSDTLASGYAAVTYGNRWDNSTQVNLGGGIQAGWLDWFNGGSFNRTAYTDLLIRDALSWSASTPTETLRITGLIPGSYNLTVYGADPQYNDKKTSYSIDQNDDGTADVSTTIRNSLSETSKTVSVTISAAGVLRIAVVAIDGAGGAFNGLDLVPSGGGGGDTTAPAAVGNLATSNPTGTSITLTWTAPGDDGSTGTATSYDIRYSTSTINDANWASAAQVTGEPAPAAAGTNQNVTVSGLSGSTTYYFAMKTCDEVPNVSTLSNVASGTTLDVTAPAAVNNLAAGTPTSSSLTLTWTSPGDDGSTGTATSYDIRYSTSTINDTNWASATPVTGEPTPAAAGTAQNTIVSGLSAGTTYYFAMKTSDEVPNASALSNVASGQTSSGVGSGIAMLVEEHNAIARSGEVISGGVPFAVGDLTSTSGLRVTDSGGSPVPAQFAVLNRWWSPNYDNSIKWLQVVFPASVAASGSSTYYLTTGTNPSPGDPVSVAVNGSTYTVTTGPLKAVINGAAFKLFDEVYYDADDDGLYEAGEKIIQAGATDGLVITSGAWSALGIAAGDEFRSSVAAATVTVEESGPVRAVLCIKGTMQRSGQAAVNPYYEYTIRLYFTAGSPKVICHASLRNNRIVNYTVYSWPIEDMSLRSTLAITGTKSYAMLGQGTPVRGTVGANAIKVYQDSNGTDEWQTTGGTSIRGVSFRGYKMYDGTSELETSNQARGWMDVGNGTLGVAAGVREFWQQYPKALRISGSQLQVALLPSEWSEPFSLYDGSRKRHEVVYNFHPGSLSDQQVTDTYLLAERPLHLRCEPSTYVASNAWDLGLGEVSNTSLDNYNKYATTGTGIGATLGWDWYGKYYAWNPGGMHPNEGSMFMAYVLWGDWRKFERSENNMLWSDLAAVVMFDDYNLSTDWHYLLAYPNDSTTGITKMRYPDWYKRATWDRPDSGHCGMLQNLEYYYLTGDRHALEACTYYGDLATYYLWPRFDKVPRFYSTYNGDVDDPNFLISDRYYSWPAFNLVQAYEATGDSDWLHLAEIAIRGFRNTLRTSPLKFTSEILHPINDTSGIYATYWPADAKDNGASQGYAIFQMAITAKAAGMYYLATGDMDAYDVMAAHGDFLSDYGCFRDGSSNITGWPYCWGDYWGFNTTTSSVHPDLANALGIASLLSRCSQRQADAEDIWPRCTNKGDWVYLGYLMNAAANPASDQAAPAAVSNLSASQGGTGQVNLTWTAPGDNGSSGTAYRYQVKYSTAPIVESVTGWPDMTPPVPQTVNDWKSRSASKLAAQRPFVSAINVLNLPAPASAGTQQSQTVSGLATGTTYYFAIKTIDDAGNLSAISNVASAVAP